ncbi:MAG: alpha-glucan family phosphorylase, partial [Planctomycetota bacterium]
VCHMNEGHAAFMALERIRQLRNNSDLSFEEASEATRAGNVFTIHTPVKAGLDEFRTELMDKYFGSYFPHLGINRDQFLALGRVFSDDDNEPFKMPILAMRLSNRRNGVSKLHGQVSREMWACLWPRVPVCDIPIASITNGVHTKTWLANEMNSLYERYFGSHWSDETADSPLWKNIDQIPDAEFWRAHQRCKEHLIAFARRRLKAQMKRRGTYHTELNQAEEVLDPEALTIGFARRFARYKRGNLLLRDPERLIKLLTDKKRPVQIIFAGKAHPRDTEGKEIIRQIVHFAKHYDVRRRIVFLEDYDANVARFLVQGVDIWLNNPRRPMEASGTSGMKASVNGALNLSTPDGWWCEGYHPDAGWVIGTGEDYEDLTYQDIVESQTIYNLLENEIVPLFYTRSTDNLPRAWIRRVKNSIRLIVPQFNTHRMVAEYTNLFYMPAARMWNEFIADDKAKARELSRWKGQMTKAWPQLNIKDVQIKFNDTQEQSQFNYKQPQFKVGTEMAVKAMVGLGSIDPGDVLVELYYGQVDAWGNIVDGTAVKMDCKESCDQPGNFWFEGLISCGVTGKYGMAVRVLPNHPDMINPYEMQLILWETAGEKATVSV